MKRAKMIICVAVLAALSAGAAFAGEANKLSKKAIAEGWIMLFDGETLFGWEAIDKAEWKVENGAIVCKGGAKGFLVTKTEFADFKLAVDFRLSMIGSTDIGFRQSKDAGGPALQLDKQAQKLRPGILKPGKWQTAVIQAEDDRLRAAIDSKIVLNARWDKYKRGLISLAADPDNKVEFRSIYLKPLRLKSVFNGKDLTGWKVLPGHRSVYSVTPKGELNVKNGNGDIQTEGVWGDFCLQLDIISNGKWLNSGIFFRCVPGGFWAGYESQIKNQWQANDRTKPVDYGTGGLYAYQPARKVVTNDGEWFKKTIIAHGNHLAVWVNGYQTADWTDNRKPNRNPRNGRSDKPGAISIQGHDPTTDLSFKNINVAEYPKE